LVEKSFLKYGKVKRFVWRMRGFPKPPKLPSGQGFSHPPLAPADGAVGVPRAPTPRDLKALDPSKGHASLSQQESADLPTLSTKPPAPHPNPPQASVPALRGPPPPPKPGAPPPAPRAGLPRPRAASPAEPAPARPPAGATNARANAPSAPGPSLEDVPDLHSMAKGPAPAREVVVPPRQKGGQPLPARKLSPNDFGKLDLPLAAAEEDADLPAPKHGETDLPSPKLPPEEEAELEIEPDDELLPAPLDRPSRLSTPHRPAQSSFGVLTAPGAIDLSAKPTEQTLSGGFLAPGVAQTVFAGSKSAQQQAPSPKQPPAGGPAGAPAVPISEPRIALGSKPALVLASSVAPRPSFLPAPPAAVHDSEPPFAPKRRGRRVAIALAAAALAAAAAVLSPVGAPARRAIANLSAGPSGRRIGATERALREAFITDRADVSAAAIATAADAWSKAGRDPDLAPTLVYSASLYALRFGPNPAVAARLQSAFERLPGGSGKGETLARAAHAAAVRRDFAGAQQAIRPMLDDKTNPDLDVLALAGEVFLAGGNGEKAVELWSALARLQPGPRAHYGLARAYSIIERPTDADEHAKQALTIARDHAGARVVLAQNAWRNGRRDDVALPHALEATQTPQVREGAGANELVEAYALLASVHEARGRVGAAEQAWADALKVDGQSARARLGAGEALYQMGRYAEALDHFEAARQSDPQGLEPALGVAKVRLALNQPLDARQILRPLALEAEKQGKTPPRLWTLLGRAELAQGNASAAETAFRHAIALSGGGGEAAEANAALAEIAEERGQLKQALVVWRRTLDLEPQRAEWHYRFGRLSARIGHDDDARSHLYTAVQTALAREPPPPWTPDACLRLAHAERKAGQLSSATTHYRCALAKP
jgi:tetratricopeptide (TPR) repeat protein